jgi:hypothetical protein
MDLLRFTRQKKKKESSEGQARALRKAVLTEFKCVKIQSDPMQRIQSSPWRMDFTGQALKSAYDCLKNLCTLHPGFVATQRSGVSAATRFRSPSRGAVTGPAMLSDTLRPLL